MPQIINTNISSLIVQRSLNQSQQAIDVSLERLSTGLRINSARDDAAGLAQVSAFTSQIRGLNQAVRNANDATSLAQVAEGGLQQSAEILQRIQELALQSANGNNSSSERYALQQEVAQLKEELDSIARATTFGGRRLLDGSFGVESFQVGVEVQQSVRLALAAADTAALGGNTLDFDGTAVGEVQISSGGFPIGGLPADTYTIQGPLGEASVTHAGSLSAADLAERLHFRRDETGVSADARTVATFGELSDVGLLTFDFGTSSAGLQSVSVNVSSVTDLSDVAAAINQHFGDTGISATTSDGVVKLISEAGDDIIFTNFNIVGATGEQARVRSRNYDDTGATATASNLATLTESNHSTRVVGHLRLSADGAFFVDSGIDALITSTHASSVSPVASIDISTQSGAQAAVAVADAAIRQVDRQRAVIGAFQSRLESTIASLQGLSENITVARSRVQDTDFAAETAELTRNQILQQAGIAILVQANALPQQILRLLQ